MKIINRRQFINTIIGITCAPVLGAIAPKCQVDVIYDPLEKRWIQDPLKKVIFSELNQTIEFDHKTTASVYNMPIYNEHNIVIGNSHVEVKFQNEHRIVIPLVKRITDLAIDKWSFWNSLKKYDKIKFVEFIYNNESNLFGYNYEIPNTVR